MGIISGTLHEKKSSLKFGELVLDYQIETIIENNFIKLLKRFRNTLEKSYSS